MRKSGGVFADAKKLSRRHPAPKGRKRNKNQPKKAWMARKGDRAGIFYIYTENV